MRQKFFLAVFMFLLKVKGKLAMKGLSKITKLLSTKNYAPMAVQKKT